MPCDLANPMLDGGHDEFASGRHGIFEAEIPLRENSDDGCGFVDIFLQDTTASAAQFSGALADGAMHMTDKALQPNIDDAVYAGQILDGAKNIAKYLIYLGFSDMTEKKVFHWAADGRLPVKKIGNRLITNKHLIQRHLNLCQ